MRIWTRYEKARGEGPIDIELILYFNMYNGSEYKPKPFGVTPISLSSLKQPRALSILKEPRAASGFLEFPQGSRLPEHFQVFNLNFLIGAPWMDNEPWARIIVPDGGTEPVEMNFASRSVDFHQNFHITRERPIRPMYSSCRSFNGWRGGPLA